MNKAQAIQAAANATQTAMQAINDYGRNSTEANGALRAARQAVFDARQLGATDDDIRAAHPA
ncbi:hypothetical protein [Streptomyces sp. NPDC029554]|uniref:hypothetical protein n=1 Tax=Streptomyces sp. NPDC029554 TaxID=3155126 RepID=UPI0033C2220D